MLSASLKIHLGLNLSWLSHVLIDNMHSSDAATGTAHTAGGLGTILTQKDKYDNFYAISYASCQLKDHEKNYSPFLLELAAAVWGMDTFNEYLKGKKFILNMDHKPLEKMVHLHTKTMNRLQSALLEHDFIIQYKKGTIMPADYLSRLPSTNKNQLAEVAQCFDPFQPELIDLQKADPDLQKMNYFWMKGEWPPHVTKADGNYLQNLAVKLFQDANKIVWIQLDDYKYPRTALYLPEKFRKNGTMRGSQSPIWQSQCCPKNIHPPHFIILLAKNLF